MLRTLCVDPPEHVVEAVGPRPDGLAGREEWARLAAELEDYMVRYGEPPDPELARSADPLERAAREELEEHLRPFQPPPPRPSSTGPEDLADGLDLDVDDFDLGP